jgi:hypothetical protein
MGMGYCNLSLGRIEAAAAGRSERAVASATAAEAFRAPASTVHPMDPGVADPVTPLKVSIPKGTLEWLVARAATPTAPVILAMARESSSSSGDRS